MNGGRNEHLMSSGAARRFFRGSCTVLLVLVVVLLWTPGMSLTAKTPYEVPAGSGMPVSIASQGLAAEGSATAAGAAHSASSLGQSKGSAIPVAVQSGGSGPLVNETLDLCTNLLYPGNYLPYDCGAMQPISVAYDSGKGEVFVANHGTDNVSVVSDGTVSVVAAVQVGLSPWALTYDSGKGEVFVANYGAGSVSVISDTTNSVVTTISVGSEPIGLVYDSGQGEIFVTNYGSDNVSVISDATNQVVRSIPVGVYPFGLAYLASSGKVLVSNYGSNNVSVISDATDAVTGSIPVGSGPEGLVHDTAKGEVFVANYASNNVTVISDATSQSTASIGVGSIPRRLAYDNQTGQIFVANYGSNNVSVISDANNSVTISLPVGANPIGVAYDYGRGPVFVSNYGQGTLSVIHTSGAYPVRFSESGLPSGTNWSVTMGGQTLFTTGSAVTFDLLNGTWTYAVSDLPGWHQTTLPYAGSVVVKGAAVVEPSMLFARVTYSVQFQEAGLPTGTHWWVNISGPISVGGTSSSLVLTLGNGTYSYSTANANKSYEARGGSVTVAAAPSTLNITFNLLTYGVSFSEVGLPPGTLWNLTVGSSSYQVASSSVSFFDPNGTYSFVVGNVPGYSASPSAGNLTVNGGATLGPTIQFSSLPLRISTYTILPASVLVGATMYLNVSVVGGLAPYSYAFSGLPQACLSYDTPQLTCSPTVAGLYHVTVTVTDNSSVSVSAGENVTVSYPPIVITSFAARPSSVVLGGTTAFSLTANGGHGAYSFSYAGLPVGCASANLSALSCTPLQAGNFTISVWVNDSAHQSAWNTTPLAVTSVPPAPITASLTSNRTSVSTGMAFSLTVSATGGATPYSYAWAVNGTNVTSAPATATWSLSLPHPGIYSFRVWVSDSRGDHSSTGAVGVTVVASAPPGGGGAGNSTGDPLTTSYSGVPLWVLLVIVVAAALIAAVLWMRRRPASQGAPPSGSTPSAVEEDDSAGDLDHFVPATPRAGKGEDWDEEGEGSGTIVLNTPSGTRIAYDERTGAVLATGRPRTPTIQVERELGEAHPEENPFGDEIRPEEVNPNVVKVDPQLLRPLEMRVVAEGGKPAEVVPPPSTPSEQKAQELVARAQKARKKRATKSPPTE